MPASCWVSLASRNDAEEREPPLSNADQQVGEIWMCRREKGLCITLGILESWSPASAHASSKEGTPWHGPTAGQAAGGSVPTLNISLPLLHNRCKTCVKKSTCFREGRLDWSITGFRRYPKYQEPSRRYKASRVCVLSACGLGFYLKRMRYYFQPSLTPCWMPHQGAFQVVQACCEMGVHRCHERVHAADTCPPALPGQGPVPELTSAGGEIHTATAVSARCSLLPIPSHCSGNGHSRGAETRARGLGRCRPVLLAHHLAVGEQPAWSC